MYPIPILYVIPRMSVGGAEMHLLGVLRLLDRRRFSPMLCCLTTDGQDSFHLLERVRELGLPIFDARVRNVPYSLIRPHTFLQMARIARIMRNRRVKIVHSYLFHANWFGTLMARIARVPVIIASKRSLDVYSRTGDRWACRVVNRLADCVTANAWAVRDHVHQTEGCPLEKIVIIPNGIDPTLVSRNGARRAALPDLTDQGPVLGTVGRLSWKKGQENLLEAAALVIGQVPEARFFLVGDGPLRAELQSQARRLGIEDKVHFAGWVEDSAWVLSQMDVFVLPSHMEGMSNSLLEAMAAGKPVVATNVGGNPEVVVDERTGFLVPPKNPRALASAILRILADRELARRLGEAGRARVESEFTVEKMVARMEDLYDSLLAARAPNHLW
ncbi:MAG: glycosyltransferase [Deltaproteobacteria bacterium]|nr:glycosyltransferase [Deltaproteobacteria bacterium]